MVGGGRADARSPVSPEISPPTPVTTIDAEGLTLLPGVIDPQVHFREPGLEHKEYIFTASCACAKGGVTSFLEMPNTRPLTTTQQALDDKLQRAANKCVVNYGFSVTPQHLLLNTSAYETIGTLAQMNPPLRSPLL